MKATKPSKPPKRQHLSPPDGLSERAKRIFDAGTAGYRERIDQLSLLYAFAAMIDYATAPKAAPAGPVVPDLGFTTAHLLEACCIDPGSVPTSQLPRLAQLAYELDMTATDLPRLHAYLTDRMLPWYREHNFIITTTTVHRNLARWLEESRAHSITNNTAPEAFR